MVYMQQIYCNKKIRNKLNKEGNILARKFEGDLPANVVQGQQLGHLGDVCTRSLTVAMWIISFPKVLIGCALSNH